MFVLIILHIALLPINRVESTLLVHSKVGTIQGLPANDGDYTMFLGIPYAKVNKSNPFGASIPHEKFDGVFEAVQESPMCPQMSKDYRGTGETHYVGNLDCLRLNVYVPNSGTKDKAVYIYIYGGKLLEGHGGKSDYGPKYLVRHDVIVVTFNYRLGPYGFLCVDIPEIPGNEGLKDQYKAIEWVRDNIREFTGDPQKITVGGHSAGAMFVDMHLLTKHPKLFQRAIMQSGSATTAGFIAPSDPMELVNIANTLGYKTNDTHDALSFLAKANPKSVIEAMNNKQRTCCVEKEFDGVFHYILENPELSEGTKNIDGINILGGLVAEECLYSLRSTCYRFISGKADIFRYELGMKFDYQKISHLVEDIKHFYQIDNASQETNNKKIVEFVSDFDFVYPLQRQLIKYSKYSKTDVYLYLFSYDGTLNRFKRLYNITEPGTTHADDLGYIFTMDLIPDLPNEDDKIIIDRMTTLLTNFIKYGNPTPQESNFIPVIWPSLTPDSVRCLQIDRNLSMVSRPFHKNMAFWDLFYEGNLDKLRIAPAKTSSSNNLFVESNVIILSIGSLLLFDKTLT